MTMEATKLDAMREALLARRKEIEDEIQRLDTELRAIGADQDLERGGLGNHFAEDGSSVTEQERISTLSDHLHGQLQQVESALERMEKGTYGICQRCGKPINEERLEAFPYVAYCIECQSQLERQQALRARY